MRTPMRALVDALRGEITVRLGRRSEEGRALRRAGARAVRGVVATAGIAVVLGSAARGAVAAPRVFLGPLASFEPESCATALPILVPLPQGGFAAAWPEGWGGPRVRIFDRDFRPLSGVAEVGDGLFSAVAAARDAPTGGVLVAWSSYRSGEIQARRYSPLGAALSAPFRLVDAGSSEVGSLALVAARDGWTALVMSRGDGLSAQWFDPQWQPRGTAFVIASPITGTPSPSIPAAAIDSTGRLIVAWSAARTTQSEVRIARFDRTGSSIGGAVTVARSSAAPVLAVLPDDGIALAWVGTEVPARLWWQRFDAVGQAVTDPRVVEDARFAGGLTLAADTQGRLALAWSRDGTPALRELLPSALQPTADLHPELAASGELPGLTALPDGRLVASWLATRSANTDPPTACDTTDGIAGRLVDLAAGLDVPAPDGPEILLNAVSQTDSSPAIAFDGSGGFAAVWIENQCRSAGSQRVRILARAFFADGTSRAAERELMSESCPSTDSVYSVDIGGFPGGGFAAVWSVSGPNAALRARFLDTDGVPEGAATALGEPGASAPKVATWRDGFFVLSSERSGTALRLESFDRTGVPRAAPLRWPGTYADLIVPPEGGAIVAWTRATYGGVVARRYAVDLRPLSDEIAVSTGTVLQGSPRLASQPGGGFAVAWNAVVPPSSKVNEIRLRRFDAHDRAAGDPQAVASASGEPTAFTILGATALVAQQNGTMILAGSGMASDHLNHSLAWEISGGERVGPGVALPADYGTLVAGDGCRAWLSWPRVVFGPGTSQRQGRAQRWTFAPDCSPDLALELAGQRFRVTVAWRGADGTMQPAVARPLTAAAGAFWFFDPENLETLVKVVDGRSVNGSFWVFYATLTNRELEIVVSDTATGERRIYAKPQGRLESRADVTAFPQNASARDALDASPSPPSLPAELVDRAPAAAPTTACLAGGDALCLLGSRFRVTLEFYDPTSRQWTSARSAPITGDTGAFWFASADNLELLVKVIDGRAVNGKYWVFWGGVSNLRFRLVVTNSVSGKRRIYANPQGMLQSLADTNAF